MPLPRELLAEHPELPRHSLFVASACADVDEVRRHLAGRQGALAGRQGAAGSTGGPYGWSPLLYQAYARHNPGVELAATLETARLLLAAGADPNDGRFWHALPTPFTVLTGVLGYGERRQPWHPHAIAFARLLLESGADPNDGQTLYNRMFGSNDDHLVLLFQHGLGRDIRGPWQRLLGESLEPPTEMLRSLLAWAIIHDQRDRVALLAEHGVDIVSPFTEQRSPRRGTPVEVALMNGHRELADQLEALGARPPQLGPNDAFVAAVLAGDAELVQRTPSKVVAEVRRKRPGLVTWAAAQGAPNAVELLVAAGFDINALGRSDLPSNEPWHTALHVAAENGNLELARRLVELGADPTIADKHYKSTALGLPALRPAGPGRTARAAGSRQIVGRRILHGGDRSASATCASLTQVKGKRAFGARSGRRGTGFAVFGAGRLHFPPRVRATPSRLPAVDHPLPGGKGGSRCRSAFIVP